MSSWWGGMFSIPARCLNRNAEAAPLPPEPSGTYATMYGNDPHASGKMASLISQGWTLVEVEPQSIKRFFEMKDWCEATAGKLGDEWLNANLREFLFRRKDLAVMFKLTFHV